MQVFVVHRYPEYETGEIVGVRRSLNAAKKLAEGDATLIDSRFPILGWEGRDEGWWTADSGILNHYDIFEKEMP